MTYEARRWRIWSNEHNGWWRPDAWGYTTNATEAGRFTAAQALPILTASADGTRGEQPHELLVDPYGFAYSVTLIREEDGSPRRQFPSVSDLEQA